jgi:hypothetical protein
MWQIPTRDAVFGLAGPGIEEKPVEPGDKTRPDALMMR